MRFFRKSSRYEQDFTVSRKSISKCSLGEVIKIPNVAIVDLIVSFEKRLSRYGA